MKNESLENKEIHQELLPLLEQLDVKRIRHEAYANYLPAMLFIILAVLSFWLFSDQEIGKEGAASIGAVILSVSYAVRYYIQQSYGSTFNKDLVQVMFAYRDQKIYFNPEQNIRFSFLKSLNYFEDFNEVSGDNFLKINTQIPFKSSNIDLSKVTKDSNNNTSYESVFIGHLGAIPLTKECKDEVTFTARHFQNKNLIYENCDFDDLFGLYCLDYNLKQISKNEIVRNALISLYNIHPHGFRLRVKGNSAIVIIREYQFFKLDVSESLRSPEFLERVLNEVDYFLQMHKTLLVVKDQLYKYMDD